MGKASRASETRSVTGQSCGRCMACWWARSSLRSTRKSVGQVIGHDILGLSICSWDTEVRLWVTSSARWRMAGRWTGVGYAKQVVGRMGTKGAVTPLNRCKKCRLVPRDDFMWLLLRKQGACEIAQSPHEVLLCVLRCSW